MVQRIPFAAPFAEMLGTVPRVANVALLAETGTVDNRPLCSEKAFTWSCAAEKYTVLLKYAGMPKSGPTAPASD